MSRLCWLLAIAIVLAACEPRSAAEPAPRPMGDSDASIFELAPGEQEALIVLWEPGLTEHYAGGACRVDLRLHDGSIVASSEFSL